VVPGPRADRDGRVAPPGPDGIRRRPALAGVEVRAIEQANGTDELAEVTFDDVVVSSARIVGELGGGWRVAMHILAHERLVAIGDVAGASAHPCVLGR